MGLLAGALLRYLSDLRLLLRPFRLFSKRFVRMRRGVLVVAQLQKVRDAVRLDNRGDGLASRLDLFQAFATSAAKIEGLDVRLGLGHSGPKGRLGCRGMAHRAHHQAALRPCLPLPIDFHAHRHLMRGIPVRRDDLVSVVYSTKLNSTTSLVLLQRTDRYGILDEKPPTFQLLSG